MVKLLLEKGANIEAKNREGWNSLMKGKYFKFFILLRLLNLFYFIGAEKRNIELVKLLLENGAHTETRNCNENTALIIGNLLNYLFYFNY